MHDKSLYQAAEIATTASKKIVPLLELSGDAYHHYVDMTKDTEFLQSLPLQQQCLFLLFLHWSSQP